MNRTSTLPDMSIAIAALTTRADGTIDDPQTDEEWKAWVSASTTRNHLKGDPLLDWLHRYGQANGFQPDDEIEGSDPRTDFLAFIFEQGQRFEDGVLRLIGERFPITRIATGHEDARSLARAVETVEAMAAGAPIIAQGVLRNPDNRTYGMADLLVRSDILDELVPGTIDEAAARVGAPNLGGDAARHYRVIDVKFTTLDIDAERGIKEYRATPAMAQVWVYNEALGRIQGYRPPAAYLLGRRWKTGWTRGESCFERLARVDHDAIGDQQTGATLAALTGEAIDWIRRMRGEGAAWRVLPEPSVPELYPNARSGGDAPWHGATSRIAADLAELTLLPGMTPPRRRAAHARGLRRWDQPGVSATTLEVPEKQAPQCDAVLAVNRDGGPAVLPEHIDGIDPAWRTAARLEFYVDFETVSDLGDDFSQLPDAGGQTLIFQIGCGYWDKGTWRFLQWTVDRLTEADEGAMIGLWIAGMDAIRQARRVPWKDVRLVHWWKAETSSLLTAYNSARTRHGDPGWPALPFFDFLTEVMRAVPVTVRGAFGFGLKPLAKAMHGLGFIETTWGDGPADGMGAMVGAWWCDAEAARTGVTMPELPLMIDIGRYNEVDCRAMAELVTWLRVNR